MFSVFRETGDFYMHGLPTMSTIKICLVLILSVIKGANANLSRQQVASQVLNSSRYDSSIVPDFDSDYPTNVTIQIIVSDMYSVSETLMEYSLDVMLRQWWRDDRLEYSSMTKDILELDPKTVAQVWQPDLFFANEKRATVHTVTTTNKLMHMHPNGTVIYSMRLAMTLSCTMNLRIYPFDSQRCPLYVKSFAYTKDNIKLHWNPTAGLTFGELEMPQFELQDDVKLTDYEDYDVGIGRFSTLKAEIHIERKIGFFFLQVFIPSILLVSLSWVNFWVDPNAVPARVSLGVTCILTMTTQSSGTRQSLPPVSYIKAIDIWMFVCLVFVFAALLEFAYINVLMRTEDKYVESPQDGDNPKRTRKDMALKVDNISKIAFPSVFILFVISFAIGCTVAQTN